MAKKSIKVIITDNGLEEMINLDCENDPDFKNTLAYVLCEVFDAEAVDYAITVFDENEKSETE